MMTFVKQKRVWVPCAVIVVLAGGFGLVSLVRGAYTGSLHCGSCHPQQTEQWQRSGAHSIQTHCADCHAPWPHVVPTRINLFQQYREAVLPINMKARDSDISDNCLECHREVTSGSYRTSNITVMSHRVHLEEGMLCVDCHRNVSHDTMSGQTYRPTKKVCYECHLRDIDVGSSPDQACLNCHRIILSRKTSQQE